MPHPQKFTVPTPNNCHLIVFAKAPVPGTVKTRLTPALDEETAALLHVSLVERTLHTARESGIATIELCCAPDTRHRFFADCAEDFGASLTPQGAGDLGDRMLAAFERALKTHRAAIIVGADCPALTGRHITDAAAMLATHDAVLTPAEDGGYVLIGVTRADSRMFEKVEWGGDQVLARQRQNFSTLGYRWHEMPTLWDVDRPEDLPRVKALKPPLDFFWPA